MSSGRRPYFILLCAPSQLPRYRSALERISWDVIVVHTVPQALALAIEEPPRALAIDTAQGSSIDRRAGERMDGLGVAWPILRSHVLPNGRIEVAVANPLRRESMVPSFEALAREARDWRHPHSNREYLRVPVQCRARFRLAKSECWHSENLKTLSARGAQVYSYEAPQVGSELDVEILDLRGAPFPMRAVGVWSRKWEDSTQLPSFGIRFEEASMSDRFIDALRSPELLARLGHSPA